MRRGTMPRRETHRRSSPAPSPPPPWSPAAGGRDRGVRQGATAHRGAELFNERCSGCHSLEAANAYGSKPAGQIEGGERTNGPNFNVRKEDRSDVLFAIRNGGFSGAIMPANIVVGEDADAVADFLAKYSGRRRAATTT